MGNFQALSVLYDFKLFQLKELSKELEVLPNDSLLAAAFITFLAEEEEVTRR